MKIRLISIAAAGLAALLLASCGTTPLAADKASGLVSKSVSDVMTGTLVPKALPADSKAGGAYSFNFAVNSSLGGSAAYSYNVNVLVSPPTYDASIAYDSFKVKDADGAVYTLGGAITFTATVTASTTVMAMIGNVTVTDQDGAVTNWAVNINSTVAISMVADSVTVTVSTSGTMGGQTVNYNQTYTRAR